jgi:hypothetical protein
LLFDHFDLWQFPKAIYVAIFERLQHLRGDDSYFAIFVPFAAVVDRDFLYQMFAETKRTQPHRFKILLNAWYFVFDNTEELKITLPPSQTIVWSIISFIGHGRKTISNAAIRTARQLRGAFHDMFSGDSAFARRIATYLVTKVGDCEEFERATAFAILNALGDIGFSADEFEAMWRAVFEFTRPGSADSDVIEVLQNRLNRIPRRVAQAITSGLSEDISISLTLSPALPAAAVVDIFKCLIKWDLEYLEELLNEQSYGLDEMPGLIKRQVSEQFG